MRNDDCTMSGSKLPLYIMATLSIILVLYNFVSLCLRNRPPPDTGAAGISTEESTSAANIAGHVSLVINDLIPSYKYSKGTTDDALVGAEACAVCLTDFDEGDDLRMMRECLHPFHAACIDLWLFKNPICPVCRTNQLNVTNSIN